MRILCAVEILEIIGDLKHELETKGINLGMQRVQHHDIVKVGCVFDMIHKTDTQQWSDRLQKILLQVLKHKPKTSLQACKINDRSCNKAANNLKFKMLSRKKNEKHDNSR